MGVIHYAPGDRPLCGNESMTTVYTDDPAAVAGCADCIELVIEDLQDHNNYLGRCLHCRQEITAQGGVQRPRHVSDMPALSSGGEVRGLHYFGTNLSIVGK